jgi:hypothetical protein
MNKYKVFVIMLVAIMCLGSVSIPNAFSQVANTNVKVLSYSYYVNPAGDFIVVGEVQNTGNSNLTSVTLNATAYDSGQNALAGSAATAYVSNFLTQQKAPFYIDLGPSNIAGTDWGSTVSSVEFVAFNAYSTSDQQYNGLALGISFNGTLGGSYIATGLLFNIGNQTASGIKVVGTYYNSLGTVVAVGYANVNDTLAPGNYTTYTVSEFDATPSLVAQISNCSILVQTSTLQNNNLPPTASPTKPLPDTYVYAIIAGTAAVAAILIVIALLMLRKRRVTSVPPPPPPPPTPESQEYKATVRF